MPVRHPWLILGVCFFTGIILFHVVGRSQRTLGDPAGRDLYARATFHVLSTHPLMGLGPGNYFSKIRDYLSGPALRIYKNDPDAWQHLHSLYLQMLVEYGLVGALLWASAFFYLIYKSWVHSTADLLSRCFKVSVVAFLIHNLFDVITVNRFDILFAILLVLITAQPEVAISASER
jgi:O-antigen ligase